MSNFECPHCGMVNIDCGKDEFKTPREIDLEQENKELREGLEILETIMNKKRDRIIKLNLEKIEIWEKNNELKKLLQKEEEINVKLAQESVEVNDRLQQNLEKDKERIKELETILEKIKEVCKEQVPFADNSYCELQEEILQIIEE